MLCVQRGRNRTDYEANLKHVDSAEKALLPLTGESMLPIPENSIIVSSFIRDWQSIKDDTLCILILKSTGQDLVFKSVKNRIRKEGCLELHSLNPEFKPYVVQVDEILEIWKFEKYISDVVPGGNVSMQMIASAIQGIKVDIAKIADKGSSNVD